MPSSTAARRSFAATVGPLVLVAAGLVAAGPVGASPEERRLEAAQERLRDVRADLDAARESRDAEARALEVAEERVAEVMDAVDEAERAVERQERAVRAAEAELDELTAEAHDREQVIEDRVRELYQSGGHDWLGSLLSAGTPGDAVRRSSMVEAIQRSDRMAFQDVAAARTAVDAQATRLEEERQSLERVLVQQRELLAEAEQLREDRAVALADTEERLERLEAREDRLADERRELAAADRSARAQSASRSTNSSSSSGSSGSSEQASGGWRWPASGTVTSEYGMRWGRLHAGIDIAASTGTPIVAARGGTVSFTGWSGGYGNLVRIDHGGGVETRYAHLSSIDVSQGQQVSAGQRLGGMGCTGSCTGTHLHYEVRINGNPQNPRGYLP